MEDFFEYKVWFSTVNISNKKKFILLDNMENEKHIYENRKFLSRKNKYLKNLDVDMQNEEVENKELYIESDSTMDEIIKNEEVIKKENLLRQREWAMDLAEFPVEKK